MSVGIVGASVFFKRFFLSAVFFVSLSVLPTAVPATGLGHALNDKIENFLTWSKLRPTANIDGEAVFVLSNFANEDFEAVQLSAVEEPKIDVIVPKNTRVATLNPTRILEAAPFSEPNGPHPDKLDIEIPKPIVSPNLFANLGAFSLNAWIDDLAENKEPYQQSSPDVPGYDPYFLKEVEAKYRADAVKLGDRLNFDSGVSGNTKIAARNPDEVLDVAPFSMPMGPHPDKLAILKPGATSKSSANLGAFSPNAPIKEIARGSKPRHKYGTELYGQYQHFLKDVEGKYGVDAPVIMGIWGIETNYGSNFGRVPVREALLSYGRARPDRHKFVKGEIAALNRLAAKGHIDPGQMSSFAGAMGHTQFIPSSIERFAVDGDGDGKIDLWEPKDALASTANYLSKHGWEKGQPWGLEIQAPEAIFSKSGARSRQPISYWVSAGVRPKHAGTKLPESGHARLQRYKGRNYLLFDNFFVIMTYNHSTEYAYQVASLGDQVLFPERAGVHDIALSINGPDTGGNWRGGGSKSGAKKSSGGGTSGGGGGCGNKVCQVQKALKSRGYYNGSIDGSYGPQLQKAIVKFQVANRLPPDGRITKTLTNKLN